MVSTEDYPKALAFYLDLKSTGALPVFHTQFWLGSMRNPILREVVPPLPCTSPPPTPVIAPSVSAAIMGWIFHPIAHRGEEVNPAKEDIVPAFDLTAPSGGP